MALGRARQTIAAVAGTAERFANADFPPRVRATAALAARTGYAEPVIDYALDRLFEGLNQGALSAAICGELGSLDILERFVARSGRPEATAAAAGRVVIVASDTTVGVALPAAAFALCAGCDVLVRERDDCLVAAFSATLAQESPEAAGRLQTVSAGAYGDPNWISSVGFADVVVVFGADTALRDVRSLVKPEARFVGYGHRTSATYVAREALAGVAALAAGIARDTLLYDGEGCLSSHAVFVERDPAFDSRAFVAVLDEAFRAADVEFGLGAFAPSGPMLAYRDAARFRSVLGGGTVAWSQRYLIVADPPRSEPPPLLPRTLAVYSVDGPAEFVEFVRAHRLPLEAVAVAGSATREDIAAAVLACGAARIARAGNLQSPSFAGEHGGLGRITPFVRFVTRDA